MGLRCSVGADDHQTAHLRGVHRGQDRPHPVGAHRDRPFLRGPQGADHYVLALHHLCYGGLLPDRAHH